MVKYFSYISIKKNLNSEKGTLVYNKSSLKCLSSNIYLHTNYYQCLHLYFVSHFLKVLIKLPLQNTQV